MKFTRNWGRGGMVGVGKAIYQHDKTIVMAKKILAEECGKRHQKGTHSLCPECQKVKP